MTFSCPGNIDLAPLERLASKWDRAGDEHGRAAEEVRFQGAEEFIESAAADALWRCAEDLRELIATKFEPRMPVRYFIGGQQYKGMLVTAPAGSRRTWIIERDGGETYDYALGSSIHYWVEDEPTVPSLVASSPVPAAAGNDSHDLPPISRKEDGSPIRDGKEVNEQ